MILFPISLIRIITSHEWLALGHGWGATRQPRVNGRPVGALSCLQPVLRMTGNHETRPDILTAHHGVPTPRMLMLVNPRNDDELRVARPNADESSRGGREAGGDSIPGDAAAVAVVEPASLDQFFAGISTRAFRFAEIGLRHREDALDAVQDSMVKMLNYRERPSTEWTPLFWSVLRSRIIDIQRRRSFRLRWLAPAGGKSADSDDAGTIDWVDPGPDPSRQHDGREGYARLVEALRDLPRRQREAFGLRILEELDVATTAQAMGCSEGSVKTHLSRAREALKQQLEDWR